MIKSSLGGLFFNVCLAGAASAAANGIYNDSPTARGMSLGGAETAGARSPLEALSANPAALGETDRPAVDVGVTTGFVHGEFKNSANSSADFNDTGTLPTGAISFPAGPIRFGLGVYAQSSLKADWQYRDAPGGADGFTSYGLRTQKSEILLIRTAFGVAWKATDQLSVGLSVGLLYNKNQLDAPYIFQTQPVLKGVKTLLDLETEGWGWNLQGGILWKPLNNLRFGLSYTSEARISTDGTASGNAGVQLTNLGLGAARHDFNYDAEVTNNFPQVVSGGVYWNVTPKVGVTAQVDWIGWRDSFDTLNVRLKNGNNVNLNGLVGSNHLNDSVPLDWKNQFVLRLGVEVALSPDWTARAGYSYAPDPVPGTTLTPLTAAIAEHTVGAGLGFHKGPFKLDFAWEWALPITAHTGRSDLLSGEYSNSSVEVSTQWLSMTAGMTF